MDEIDQGLKHMADRCGTANFEIWGMGFLSFWLEDLVNLSIYCMDMMFICLNSMIIFLCGILYHYQCDLGGCLFSPSTGSFGNVSASPTSVVVNSSFSVRWNVMAGMKRGFEPFVLVMAGSLNG